MLYSLDFFSEFKCTNVLHPAQFVDLPQGQFGLAQISKFGLAVILCQILIWCASVFVKFVEYHVDIYAGGGVTGWETTAAPGCDPGAGAVVVTSGGGSAAVKLARSWPAAISVSMPAGLMPTPRRS